MKNVCGLDVHKDIIFVFTNKENGDKVEVYITIEKYTIFQLKSIPVLIVCEDKKSYLNAG